MDIEKAAEALWGHVVGIEAWSQQDANTQERYRGYVRIVAPYLQADPSPREYVHHVLCSGDRKFPAVDASAPVDGDLVKAMLNAWHANSGSNKSRMAAVLRVAADVFENAIRAESDNSECTDNFVSAVRARIFPQSKVSEVDEALKDLMVKHVDQSLRCTIFDADQRLREAYRRGQQAKEAK